MTPCPAKCLAPGLPTGAIIIKVGCDPWYLYNFSPNKIQSTTKSTSMLRITTRTTPTTPVNM